MLHGLHLWDGGDSAFEICKTDTALCSEGDAKKYRHTEAQGQEVEV